MDADTTNTANTPDRRRITESDPDYQRLHAHALRQLAAGVRVYARDLLSLPAHQHDRSATRFIQRQLGTLREAWLAGFWEGQRDYWHAHSATTTPQAHRALSQRHGVVVPEAKLRRTLAFYGAASVAKMAREGQQAWQRSIHTTIAASEPSAPAQRDRRALALVTLADPANLQDWSSGLTARLNIQADITWNGLQDGYLAAGTIDPANPYALVWWSLDAGVKQHCSDCPSLALDSPYTAPGAGGHELLQTPGDGMTDCGGGCKCTLQYGSADAPWSPADAAHAEVAYQVGLQPAGQDTVTATSGNVSHTITDSIAPPPHTTPWGAKVGASVDSILPADLPASITEGLPEQIPAAQAGPLTPGQKQALDMFRAADVAWQAVRGNLPDMPLFWETINATSAEQQGWAGVTWNDLTPQQQAVLERAFAAVQEWADSTPIDDYGLAEPIEAGRVALFNYAHGRDGRFTTTGPHMAPESGGGQGGGTSKGGKPGSARATGMNPWGVLTRSPEAEAARAAKSARTTRENGARRRQERLAALEKSDPAAAARLRRSYERIDAARAAKARGEPSPSGQRPPAEPRSPYGRPLPSETAKAGMPYREAVNTMQLHAASLEAARGTPREARAQVQYDNARAHLDETWRAYAAVGAAHGVSSDAQLVANAMFRRDDAKYATTTRPAMRPDDFAHLVGAQHASEVSVTADPLNGTFRVSHVTPERTLVVTCSNVNGRGYAHIDQLTFHAGQSHSEQTLETARLMANLKGYAVLRIDASATRGPGQYLYYAMAHIGASGLTPEGLVGAATARFGPKGVKVRYIMGQPGGAQWWAAHGATWDATFDWRGGATPTHTISALLGGS